MIAAPQRQAGAADDRAAAAVRARRRQPPDARQQRRDARAHGADRAPRRRTGSAPLGSPTQPGSVLVTLGGAVARPGRLRDRLRQPAGRPAARRGRRQRTPAGAAGRRLRRRLARRAAHASDLTLSEGDPLLAAGSIGAGVLWVLGEGSCGVWESARVLDYLAAESAGQCGPCLHGLRAIADSFDLLARGTARTRRARAAEALGRRRHRPRRVPSPRRRRALPRQRARGLRRRDRPPPSGRLHRVARAVDAAAVASSGGRVTKSTTIRIDPIMCDGHGLCAELLPEHIRLDDWGYPIVDGRAGRARARQARPARRGRLPDPRPAAGDPP